MYVIISTAAIFMLLQGIQLFSGTNQQYFSVDGQMVKLKANIYTSKTKANIMC